MVLQLLQLPVLRGHKISNYLKIRTHEPTELKKLANSYKLSGVLI